MIKVLATVTVTCEVGLNHLCVSKIGLPIADQDPYLSCVDGWKMIAVAAATVAVAAAGTMLVVFPFLFPVLHAPLHRTFTGFSFPRSQ